MDLSFQLLIVVFVLASMLALLAFLRKKGWAMPAFRPSAAASRARELRVVDRVVVSAQHTLVLLEVKNTRMLVCLSPAASNVTVLRGEE